MVSKYGANFVIQCLPRYQNGGLCQTFYCPICEQWHVHGKGAGSRVPHCNPEIFREDGTRVIRDPPWRQPFDPQTETPDEFAQDMPDKSAIRQPGVYYIEMLTREELKNIRDDIDTYLRTEK